MPRRGVQRCGILWGRPTGLSAEQWVAISVTGAVREPNVVQLIRSGWHLVCWLPLFQSFWREHCAWKISNSSNLCSGIVSVVLFVWQPLPMCKLIRKSGQWNIVLVSGWWRKVWMPSSLRCPCLSLLLLSGISVSPLTWQPETINLCAHDVVLFDYYIWVCMLFSFCCCILYAHIGRIR